MPLHSIPVSRRQFLTSTAAALASVTVLRTGYAAGKNEPVRLALLSDTHIHASPDFVARDVNMTANLKKAVAEIGQLKHKPSGVIVNGDCAFNKGLPEDYANFAACVQPILDAEIPLHLTMGNHDDRDVIFQTMTGQRPETPHLNSKHVSIIETPFANLFLLDTLTKVNVVTGEIGEEQMRWLDKALNARRNKPAILMAHHCPQFTPPEEGKPWSGIADTAEFLKFISSKKQVKAFFFGHSHVWSVSKHNGIHLVNLPAVAYVFKPEIFNGWTEAEISKNGIDLRLRAANPDHPENLKTFNLKWS